MFYLSFKQILNNNNKKRNSRPHKINSLVLRPNFPKLDEGGRLFFFFFIVKKTDEGGFFFIWERN